MLFEISCEKESRCTRIRRNKNKDMFTQINALKYRFHGDIRMELFIQVNIIYLFEQDVFVYDGGCFIGSDGKHPFSEGRVGELDSLFSFSLGGFDGVFGGDDFDWVVVLVCFVVTSFFITLVESETFVFVEKFAV